MNELGYRPDQVAQSMRSNKHKNIALLIDISNIAFAHIAKGMQGELNELGYTLSLCDIGNRNTLERIREFLNGRRFDGIIVSIPSEDDSELNKYLANLTIPVIVLDRKIEGVEGLIETDYFSSVKKATEYLLSLGHTGIALIGVSKKIRPTKVSIKAFQEAYEEYGIERVNAPIIEGDFTSESGKQIMIDLLPQIQQEKVTAILSLNNRIFHGILKVMRKYSIDYPSDVSIITVEDDELTELLDPSITVIKRDLDEIGSSAARMLIQVVENPMNKNTQSSTTIPTEFIIRDSCVSLDN